MRNAMSANVERWMRAGVGGVVALGSNGEAPLLDEGESDRVIGAAREAVPRGEAAHRRHRPGIHARDDCRVAPGGVARR